MWVVLDPDTDIFMTYPNLDVSTSRVSIATRTTYICLDPPLGTTHPAAFSSRGCSVKNTTLAMLFRIALTAGPDKYGAGVRVGLEIGLPVSGRG